MVGLHPTIVIYLYTVGLDSLHIYASSVTVMGYPCKQDNT